MTVSKSRLARNLPRRFPVGAKYVVEGYGGAEGRVRVVARYILLPGGRRINVSGAQALSFSRGRSSLRSRAPGKIPTGTALKNLRIRQGTGVRASR